MPEQVINHRFSNSPALKFGLCIWMGLVMFTFVVLFWPPILAPLASALGIQKILQQLQAWLQPFLTADYLS